MISRREVIGGLAALGAGTLAFANLDRAQPQTTRPRPSAVRRLGVLMGPSEGDPEGIRRANSLQQGLRELGWMADGNLRIDYRWAAGEADRFRSYAKELVELQPDIILANAAPALEALSRAT